ncbi:winged helix-turn-helix transcriptional regulator [Arthrobacter sp. TMN-37]
MESTAVQQERVICDRDEGTIVFVREIVSRLGDKWSMPALDQLAGGPLRFTALQAALPPISHRVLTATLRTLEKDGMVTRTSYPEMPPRVEYALTPLGAGFLRQAMPLVGWAQEHRAEIEAHRSVSGPAGASGGS